MGRITPRSLRREKREVFDAEVRLKGREPQYRTFSDRKEAKEWVLATEADLRRGKCLNVGEAKKHTLAEAVDRYLNVYLLQYPHRIRTQTLLLAWWKKRIGDLRLSEITPATISEQKDCLGSGQTYRGQVRSGSTVNRYLAALSKVLTLCVKEWCWLDASPMCRVEKRKESPGRTRFLSVDEAQRLLEACRASRNPALYDAVVIAITTGMRYNEIVSLRKEQLDLDGGYLYLFKTKNGSERTVPLSDVIVEALRKRIQGSDEDLVFPPTRRVGNKRGLIQLRSSFAAALRQANIQGASFHTLRHTAASHFAMQGANTPALMSLLGHKTSLMSKRYTHFADSHLKKLVQQSTDRFINEHKK